MKPQKQPETANAVRTFPYRFLFVVAFIEGASVMAIELAGAKMIAPYYGSSLYVWAAVLSVTLGGLTSGYFLGGRMAYRYPGTTLLFGVLSIGTALILLMPFLPQHLMPATTGLGIRMGSLISAMGFMLLPLICMGMVSPIIIQLATKELKDTGKMAGTVYAVSTVGGIIMTLLMGFYLLPEWGIKKSVFLTGGLLGAMPVIYYFFFRSQKIITAIALLIFSMLLLAANRPANISDQASVIQYQSEGVLGQITVFDYIQTETNREFRLFLLNEIPQTQVSVKYMPVSAWSYPHRISSLASIKPAHSKALLIGMGGGSVAMELKGMGFDLDVVDIDSRIPEVAEKYFGFKPDSVHINIDDGRHFIRNAKTKYDLIVIDVLNGEVQPYQLFTMESFAALKNIIAPEGVVLINYQGYLKGEKGKSARSIYKTLAESGFQVQYHTTSTEIADGDITLIASMTKQDFHLLDSTRLNFCCRAMEYKYKNLITGEPIDLADASILTDDQPQLETLGRVWNEEWRIKALEQYGAYFATHHVPLFE